MPGMVEIVDPKKRAFLAAYAKTATVSRAAEASGCSPTSHYNWLSDPDYASAFEQAKLEAIDSLESEAVHRATDGDWVLKFEKGQMITVPLMDSDGNPILDENGNPQWVPYRERKKSDTLLIFLLKGACPEKYAERAKVDIQQKHTAEDLERFIEQQGLKRLSEAIPE